MQCLCFLVILLLSRVGLSRTVPAITLEVRNTEATKIELHLRWTLNGTLKLWCTSLRNNNRRAIEVPKKSSNVLKIDDLSPSTSYNICALLEMNDKHEWRERETEGRPTGNSKSEKEGVFSSNNANESKTRYEIEFIERRRRNSDQHHGLRDRETHHVKSNEGILKYDLKRFRYIRRSSQSAKSVLDRDSSLEGKAKVNMTVRTEELRYGRSNYIPIATKDIGIRDMPIEFLTELNSSPRLKRSEMTQNVKMDTKRKLENISVMEQISRNDGDNVTSCITVSTVSRWQQARNMIVGLITLGSFLFIAVIIFVIVQVWKRLVHERKTKNPVRQSSTADVSSLRIEDIGEKSYLEE